MQQAQFKYDVFISYRHLPLDMKIAKKLQFLLENDSFRRKNGKNLSVFRDKDELSLSSNLTAEIRNALSVSRYLVVICSKETMKSKYCRDELEIFRENHGGSNSNILCILIDGEPNESIPDVMFQEQNRQNNGECEIHEIMPLYADIRGKNLSQSYRILEMEYLRLVAAVRGVPYASLVQRQARRKARRHIIIMSVAFVILMSALLYNDQSRSSASAHFMMAEQYLQQGHKQQALQYYALGLEAESLFQKVASDDYTEVIFLLQQNDWMILTQYEDREYENDEITPQPSVKEFEELLPCFKEYFGQSSSDWDLFEKYGELNVVYSPDGKKAILKYSCSYSAWTNNTYGIRIDKHTVIENYFFLVSIEDETIRLIKAFEEPGYKCRCIIFDESGERAAFCFGNEFGMETPGGYFLVLDFQGNTLFRTAVNKGRPYSGIVFKRGSQEELAVWSKDTIEFWNCVEGEKYAADCISAYPVSVTIFEDYRMEVTDISNDLYLYERISVQGEDTGVTAAEQLGLRYLDGSSIELDGNYVIRWETAVSNCILLKLETSEGELLDELCIETSEDAVIKLNYNLFNPNNHSLYVPVGQNKFEPITVELKEKRFKRNAILDISSFYPKLGTFYDFICMGEGLVAINPSFDSIYALNGLNVYVEDVISNVLYYNPEGILVNLYTDGYQRLGCLYYYDGIYTLYYFNFSLSDTPKELMLGEAASSKNVNVVFLSNGNIKYTIGQESKVINADMPRPNCLELDLMRDIAGLTSFYGGEDCSSKSIVDKSKLKFERLGLQVYFLEY